MDRFAEKEKDDDKILSPEARLKKYEIEINLLINESACLAEDGELRDALLKAKEAVAKHKALEKYLEGKELMDLLSVELYFCVYLHVSNMYEKNELYTEALQEYSNLTNAKNNEEFNPESFVRVNMGNIYFKQKNYSMAIKMYNRALDHVPQALKLSMKYKIMRNLAHSYVKEEKYVDAITTYEEILDKAPDFESAFNLMLCYFTRGDVGNMKNNFYEMMNIDSFEDIEENEEEEKKKQDENFKEDLLKKELRKRKLRASRYILDSAKLIAPVIEQDIIDGYTWIIDTLKSSKSNFQVVLSEVEILKAVAYINQKDIEKAIECFKSFEKKDKSMMARAATNISFLYFLERNVKSSEKYAEMALDYDRFNPKALVNIGNCYFMKGDYMRAKEHYLEAIGVSADCIEALYNLSLVNKKMSKFGDALIALEKLQTIVSKNPEVLYQIASLYDLMGDNKNARKWFDILLTYCPDDPNIHAKIGGLYYIDKDETQAYHHYNESYKLLPVNIETIAWLGLYYVKQGLYEKACTFFDRASQVQPKEVKWRLMVASCYRRMEDFDKALKIYEDIYQEKPDNIECKFII